MIDVDDVIVIVTPVEAGTGTPLAVVEMEVTVITGAALMTRAAAVA
jgi:hypothetical protein